MVALAKVLWNTLWSGLNIQVQRKPSPHPPTELWLICRELVENLNRDKTVGVLAAGSFGRFHIVSEAIELFDEHTT